MWAPDVVKLISDPKVPVQLGTVVAVSFPALAYFWLLRHVARIFVSNRQQMSDAELRETMISTYLALMYDPAKAASPDERVLILNAIFRPAGAESDADSAPPNLVQLMRDAIKEK